MPITHIGNEYSGWHVDLQRIPRCSTIISAGVGTDESFALALIEQRDVYVIGIDPGEQAQEYTDHLGETHYTFIRGALTPGGRLATLYKNRAHAHGSESCHPDHRVAGAETYQSLGIHLGTLVAEHRPSLIKLDIEGAEYDVFEDCFGVDQVCIEFHHGIVSSISDGDTLIVVEAFEKRGYQLLHQTDNREYTFGLK